MKQPDELHVDVGALTVNVKAEAPAGPHEHAAAVARELHASPCAGRRSDAPSASKRWSAANAMRASIRSPRLTEFSGEARIRRRSASPSARSTKTSAPPYSTRETDPESDCFAGTGKSDGKVSRPEAQHDARSFWSDKNGSRQLACDAVKADEAATLHAAAQHVHRGQSDEASHKTIGWTLEHFARRPRLLDTAVVHDDDAVGHRHRFELVVRHIQCRAPDTTMEVNQRLTHLMPQAARRDWKAVRPSERRLDDARSSVPAPHAVADRQIVATAAGSSLSVKSTSSAASATRLAIVGAVEMPPVAGRQRKRDVLAHRHMRIERVGLEHHGDIALRRPHVIHDRALDEDFAFVARPRCRRSCAGSCSCRSPKVRAARRTRLVQRSRR